MNAVLSLRGLRKNFGATAILQGVDLDILAGERHAIIGPNGAGKSTLFHIISGHMKPTSGDIRLHGQPIGGLPAWRINRAGLARNFQVTNLFANLSVFDNLRCGVLRARGGSLAFWRSLAGRRAVREHTEFVLREIGLAARRDAAAGTLSYAEQRSLEIGVTISGGAEVILLDEPTAGMSRHETERAIALIRKVTAGKTLLMVEHDMSVVFELADRLSVLVYGGIIATGTPAAVRANPAVQEAYLGREEDAA